MEDLRPFRVFLEVADQQSFSGAARALGLTPASVTRIVAGLEADLARQLLLRTTRQVSLTADGAAIAARYRPIIDAFDATTAQIKREARPDDGHLRINAPLSFGMRHLPSIVETFRLAYPRITLDVRLTDSFIDIIEEPCDLAIRISRPPTDKSTIWRKLCEVPRHAIAAPSLFTRIPRPEGPDDLNPAFALSYSEDGRGELWEFTRAGSVRTIRAGTQVVTNNGDLLYDIVRAGGGIAVLPDFLIAPGVASGEVDILLDDWTLPSLWLTLYYPPYEALPPLVATFSEFFEAYLRDQAGLSFGS